MEKIKKPLVDNTTADSPGNLSQQEITITNAEKEITGGTTPTLEREHVMDTALNGGAQVPTKVAKSHYSENDLRTGVTDFCFSPQEKDSLKPDDDRSKNPEDCLKSFQRPALKNRHKGENGEPSMEASKKTRTVHWSTPVLSDPTAELDGL